MDEHRSNVVVQKLEVCQRALNDLLSECKTFAEEAESKGDQDIADELRRLCEDLREAYFSVNSSLFHATCVYRLILLEHEQ